MAAELADEFEACGSETTELDILDALASTGLTIVRANDDKASGAYFEEIAQKAKEA